MTAQKAGRLNVLRFCAFWHEVWRGRWLWLLAPVIIIMLLFYLPIALVASAVAFSILGILGPRIVLGAVVLIIGLALWMRHLNRREEREAWKRLRK